MVETLSPNEDRVTMVITATERDIIYDALVSHGGVMRADAYRIAQQTKDWNDEYAVKLRQFADDATELSRRFAYTMGSWGP